MLRTLPDPPVKRKMHWGVRVALGAMAGMVSTTIVHPLDLVKVRLQLLSRFCTTREMARQIVRCRGYRALYVGLSAGLMRQATYTTTRLGVYHQLYDRIPRENKRKTTLSEKLVVGVIAGLAGALAGNPSEVALVRMMADGPLEPCILCTCPKQYNGVMHAIYRICREEGVRALWRGGTLTLGRSVFVSVAQLGCYTQAQQMLHERRIAKGLSLHVYTSMISSFMTALLSLPVDLVKTKYYPFLDKDRYQVKKGGVFQRDILSEIYRKKGILYFWKGFVPYYIRMAIHTISSMLVVEKLHYLYFKYEDMDKTKWD